MNRPFLAASVEELEEVLRKNRSRRWVLAQLRDELKFRRSDRAKQLRREVEGLLDRRVPEPPRKLRPAKPEDQLELDEK